MTSWRLLSLVLVVLTLGAAQAEEWSYEFRETRHYTTEIGHFRVTDDQGHLLGSGRSSSRSFHRDKVVPFPKLQVEATLSVTVRDWAFRTVRPPRMTFATLDEIHAELARPSAPSRKPQPNSLLIEVDSRGEMPESALQRLVERVWIQVYFLCTRAVPRIPKKLRVELRQDPYSQTFRIAVLEWQHNRYRDPSPWFFLEEGWGMARVAMGFEADGPLTPEELALKVDDLRLGLPASELHPADYDNCSLSTSGYRVVSISGRQLSLGDQKVLAGGESPEQAGQALAALPIRFVPDRDFDSLYLGERLILWLDFGSDGLQRVTLTDITRHGDERYYDASGPALALRGVTVGMTRQQVQAQHGPPDWEGSENGHSAAGYGPRTTPELLVVYDTNDRVQRVRGDLLDQAGRVVLSSTPGLPEQIAASHLDQVLGSCVSHRRRTGKTAPTEVLYCLDEHLEIWVYPGGRRQFVLKGPPVPPDSGIDEGYP